MVAANTRNSLHLCLDACDIQVEAVWEDLCQKMLTIRQVRPPAEGLARHRRAPLLWAHMISSGTHSCFGPLPRCDAQVFLYLDRSYVVKATGVRSLFDMGLHLFRNHLAAQKQVRGADFRSQCGCFSFAILAPFECSTCVPPIGDGRASQSLSLQSPRMQLAHAAAEQGRAVSRHKLPQ